MKSDPVQCVVCGDEFRKKAAEQLSRPMHFCSIACYRTWQRRDVKARECPVCGSSFIPHHYAYGRKWQTLCSNECRGQAQRGEHNPAWLGGHPAYRGPDWDRIRERVFKRDDYQCRHCGDGASLNAHHVTPYRVTQDNSLENLITLCDTCHGLADREYVRSICYPV